MDLAYFINFFASYGYISVFLFLLLCGLGLMIPEDIILIAGGVMCGLSQDHAGMMANVHIMLFVSLFGVLFGDSIMFALGNRLGDRVTKLPVLRYIFTKKRYHLIQKKAEKYGDKILFVARFLPGLRSMIFATAGISRKISYWKFLFFDGMAALISVPILVYLGYYFAHDLDDLLSMVKKSKEGLLIAIIFFVLVYLIYRFIYRKHRKHQQ